MIDPITQYLLETERLKKLDNNKIFKFVLLAFNKENKIDLKKDSYAINRLKTAIKVSSGRYLGKLKSPMRSNKYILNVPFLTAGPDGPLHLNFEFTNKQLEQIHK